MVRNSKSFGNSETLYNSREDSSEWVWSNAPGSNNDRNEKKSRASHIPATPSQNLSDSGDNLLIDFGEKKSKTQATPAAAPAPKARTAEEEAWDMLNS